MVKGQKNRHYKRIRLIGFVSGFFISLSHILSGQVATHLSIENEEIILTDYYFDINLVRTSDAAGGDLYLGNADFVIAFNAAMFNSPTLTKSGLSPGNCSFKPSNSTTLNDLITRVNYFDNSATMINGNKLIINLNGPTPGDLAVFESRVAKIDDDSTVHRLGTFKISGVNDSNGDANLKWKTIGEGLKTTVLTLTSAEPFLSTPVILQTDSNTCPDTLVITAPLASGHYQAGMQITTAATVEVGSVIMLTAENNLEFLADFEVPLSASLEVNIQGCQ